MVSDLWMRFRALFRRGRVEGEMEEELRFDFEQRVEKYVRAGMRREEAVRQARLEFGGADGIKEECREARGVHLFETFAQDLRYTLRTLGRNPGFTTVALLTLALGIGATTVMFTVVSGVLLKPLPYRDPGRLVMLQERTDWSNAYGNIWAFAYPNYLDCKRESHSVDLAAWRYNGGTVSSKGGAEYVDGFEVSANLFSMLGVRMARGRAFRPEEDQLGGPPVAIISYGLWKRLFGGSEAALGATLSLEGKSYTVVGVAPPGFRLNEDSGDVFTVLGQDASPVMHSRDRHPGIQVVGRLSAGRSLAQANTELGVIARQLAAEYPESNRGRNFPAAPLRPEVGDVQSTLWLLLGAVSLVLLVACANVASLLLARAVSRERELAMRAALGASKSRLVRQCLTESAVLGIAGGALGVLLAYAGVQPFVALWPGTLPRAGEVQVDWRVLLFAVGASLLSGFLFGLAPAVRAPARQLEQALRAGARTVAGSSRRLHSAFVVSEIALAMVLLVGAGMLGRTLLRVSSLNPGLDIHNLLVTRFAPSPALMNDPGRLRATWDAMLQSARQVPGVESVAAVDTVPMREGNNQIGYWPAPDVPPDNKQPLALATSVTPGYFKTMGIRLERGRVFTPEDRMGSELVVVIDDVLARDAFGKQDAVGKRLWMPGMGYGPAFTVVGVVGHVRHWGLASDDQAAVRAQFYYPFAQLPDRFVPRWSQLMSIVTRTNVDPLSVVPGLRRAARAAASDQVLYEVRTMEQLTHGTLALHRFLLTLFGIFAGLALLLACIGIYGVLSYLTAQRVPEIGVRMALGASRASILQMILRQSMAIICAGAGLGLIGAVAAGRVLAHVVGGMRPVDALTLAITICVLACAAIFASFVPARRASRVDPMAALRQE